VGVTSRRGCARKGETLNRLDGKVAVITGAASGIGLAAAELFVNEGARVLAVDLQAQVLEDAIGRLGPSARSYAADVVKEPDMEAAMAAAAETFGGIDIVLANAGILGTQALIRDFPPDEMRHVLDVNIMGVVIAIKSAIPYLEKRGGGSIVITSSVAGVMGNPRGVAYFGSQHAVIGVMRVAAKEFGPLNVRVNTVNPGLVDTPMMREVEASACPEDPMKGRAMILSEPLLPPRYVQPKEVAELMLYLASDSAINCTGGIYMIDGGIQLAGGSRM
jgi:NAD(P)-dependent dehydrogenase (short-subunit alcohol dehydrogenase family)